MSNSDFWLLKINALLHDPPNKPLDIKAHEGNAANLAKILGLSLDQQDFKQADRIASAADRLNFPSYKSIGGVNFSNKPYLSHPLAGVRLDLAAGRFFPTQVDASQVQLAIRKSLESISPEIKGYPQKLFLWLWRNWSAQLQQTEGNQLDALWDLLPADSRIPDHSIWAHQALTSAIAATNSHPAFLLFTIGPVQAFISAARRTQDLWAGSYLLSYLNWTAIEVIAEEIGPDAVIFPNLLGQPLCDRWLHSKGILTQQPKPEDLILPSLPNRFLAIVPASQGADLAKKADEKMRSQWREITKAVRVYLEQKLKYTPNWSKTWERQTENIFETYWQVYPWRPTGNEPIQDKEYQRFLDVHKLYLDDRYDRTQKILEVYAKDDRQGGGQYAPNIGAIYSDLYFITEKLLGSRKGLRNFLQVDETGEKSTLGGDRACLYDGVDNLQNNQAEDFDKVPRQEIRNFWIRLAQELGNLEIQDTGQERLDAVELTKRCAWGVYFQKQLDSQGVPIKPEDLENLEEFKERRDQLRFPSTSTVATASFKNHVLEAFQKSSHNNLRQVLKSWLDAVSCSRIIRGNRIPEDVIPYLASKLKELQLSQEDKKILTQLLRTDGRLLLEETYQEELNKPLNQPHNTLERGKIQAALNGLKNFLAIVTKEYGLPKPRKYFAVLMMDGDKMGQWIAGDKMPKYARVLHPDTKQALQQEPYREDWKDILNNKRLMSPAIHGFISKALGDFSLKLVRYIVENRHPGKLVYAGGDDVLALLPLDSVLEVSRELRAAFSGEIFTGEVGSDGECTKFEVQFGKQKAGYVLLELIKGDRTSRQLLATMGHQAEASTGIAIAHYKNPLDLTLEAVRNAEKAAKSKEGRNAFNITFLKRSGEIMSAGAKWHYSCKTVDTVSVLLEFQQRFTNDEISGKFPYVLREETETLSMIENQELYAAEIKRLLHRQQGRHKLTKDEEKKLASDLAKLVMKANEEKRSHAKDSEKNQPQGKLKTFADLLVFTRFLATGEGEG